MDPLRIPPIRPQDLEIGAPSATATPKGPSFGSVLESAIESVSRAQAASDEASRLFALGRDVDLHTVLLQVEKADLSFRTMMEVRNKLLDAYREVMRMQI